MANRVKGVSANKRRAGLEREEALAETGRLHRRGYSQAGIGARLGVTPQQVSYDLKVIRQRHLDSMLGDPDALAEAGKLALDALACAAALADDGGEDAAFDGGPRRDADRA